MPNARDYFQMKKNSMKQENYQQEIRAHRRKRLLVMGLVLLAVAAVCLIFSMYNRFRVFDRYQVLTETKREDAETTEYLLFQGNVLKYNMDGASCFDQENKQLWNQSYEMKQPISDICTNYVAICDRDGNDVYLFNKSGMQGKVTTKLPVKKLSVSDKGTVAVLMEEDAVNYIDYYDSEGNLLAENKAPLEKSGFPLDISLSDDGYKLAVSYMSIENAKIETKLAFYNFDSVGENEIDHLVCATNYDGAIIPQVVFINANQAVAFGDEFFEIYEGTQKPKSVVKKEFKQEVKSIFYSKQYVGFIFDNDEENLPYRMEIYNLKGKLICSQPFNFEYESIKMEYGRIWFYNDGECVVYNMDGRQVYKGSFEENIDCLLPMSERKLFVVLNTKLQTGRLE